MPNKVFRSIARIEACYMCCATNLGSQLGIIRRLRAPGVFSKDGSPVPASETERNASRPSTSAPSTLPARPPPNRSQSAHQPRSASSPSSIEIPQAPQPTRTQSDHNLSLPSSLSAVQLPLPVVVKIKPAKELGLTHLPLMYENRNDKLYCRLCV